MLKTCKLVVWGALVCVMTACEKTEESIPVTVNAPMPAFIKQEGELFVLRHDKIRLELSPRMGGRVSSLKYDQHELLVTREQNPLKYHLWGSVLWSSPQSDWSWPPVEVLDHKPYDVTIEADRLVMTSAIDPKTGYQFVKSFTRVPGAEAVRLGYRIYNRNTEARDVAAWELTRVPPSGMTFFPGGERGVESGIFYPLKLKIEKGIVWFACIHKYLQQDHHKLMTDGNEGWLAHVDREHILVKQFPDVPAEKIAKNEGEIELFVNAERSYLELQQQGPLTRLEPGDYLEWDVVWHVTRLPEGLAVESGSEKLVSFARGLLLD